MNDNIEIIVASVPDREKLVAEIWKNNIMIAEISQEQESLELEIFFTKKKNLRFNYEEFLSILDQAKQKLLQR